MDDIEADAISFAHLADGERSFGRARGGDTMLVSKPFYGPQCQRLPSRTLTAFVAQQGEDFVVVMVDRELSNALNKGCGIADRVSSIWWQLEFERFGCSALPANV